jgi:hypothetical protein
MGLQEDVQKRRAAVNEQIKKSNEELAKIGRFLFTAPDGKALLDLLTDLYYKGPMIGETPEMTYFKLGRREVVEFLIGLCPKEK